MCASDVRSASGADGWGEGHGDGCALGGGGCWEVVHVHLHLHLRDALREAETLCERHVVHLCGHRLARWIRFPKLNRLSHVCTAQVGLAAQFWLAAQVGLAARVGLRLRLAAQFRLAS